MSLADEYRAQLAWRDWSAVFDALPALRGRLVLDFGCAVGERAAALAAGGARVIGVDANEELIREARARGLENVELRQHDLRARPDLAVTADGVWSSFTEAYFPELSTVLAAWTTHLREGCASPDPITSRTRAFAARSQTRRPAP